MKVPDGLEEMDGGKRMHYGRAIALAGLVAGLVGLAPISVLPGVAQTVAQTREQRKAEGDRLFQQGIHLGREAIK